MNIPACCWNCGEPGRNIRGRNIVFIGPKGCDSVTKQRETRVVEPTLVAYSNTTPFFRIRFA